MFIASVASVVAVIRPLLANAEDLTQRAAIASDAGTPGWPKPAWSCNSPVVWLDAPHGVYYRSGESRYGRTERGAYACEDHAVKAGHRAG
jgi:hypothetical protein